MTIGKSKIAKLLHIEEGQVSNLARLAIRLTKISDRNFGMLKYIDGVPEIDDGKDIEDAFVTSVSDKNWECGAVACAIGHGALIPEITKPYFLECEGHPETLHYRHFARKVFGGHDLHRDWGYYLFSSNWSGRDDSAMGAAKRIYKLLSSQTDDDVVKFNAVYSKTLLDAATRPIDFKKSTWFESQIENYKSITEEQILELEKLI